MKKLNRWFSVLSLALVVFALGANAQENGLTRKQREALRNEGQSTTNTEPPTGGHPPGNTGGDDVGPGDDGTGSGNNVGNGQKLTRKEKEALKGKGPVS